MTLYDKLVINKFINGSFKEFKDMNLDIAMEDMIRYIEKMGGVVTETPDLYEIQCPYLWTGKIYNRFKSFGIRPMIPSETKWIEHSLEPDMKPVPTAIARYHQRVDIADYSC